MSQASERQREEPTVDGKEKLLAGKPASAPRALRRRIFRSTLPSCRLSLKPDAQSSQLLRSSLTCKRSCRMLPVLCRWRSSNRSQALQPAEERDDSSLDVPGISGHTMIIWKALFVGCKQFTELAERQPCEFLTSDLLDLLKIRPTDQLQPRPSILSAHTLLTFSDHAPFWDSLHTPTSQPVCFSWFAIK